MKKSGKNMIKLTMVILIITIIILVGIIIKISNPNNEINKQEESKEQQLTETTSSNAYVTMEDHLSEVSSQSSDNRNYIIKDGVVQEGWNVTLASSASYDSTYKRIEFGSTNGVLVGITGLDSSASTNETKYFCVDFYIEGSPNTRISNNATSASTSDSTILAQNVSRVSIGACDQIAWCALTSNPTKYLYNMWIETGTGLVTNPIS